MGFGHFHGEIGITHNQGFGVGALRSKVHQAHIVLLALCRDQDEVWCRGWFQLLT